MDSPSNFSPGAESVWEPSFITGACTPSFKSCGENEVPHMENIPSINREFVIKEVDNDINT